VRAVASVRNRRNIRLREVAALEEQRLARVLRERVGEAVAEVETCGMNALPKRMNARRAAFACAVVTSTTSMP